MDSEELQAMFEKHNDEYVKFDRVQKKVSNRMDLHAFMLLDMILPGSCDMVAAAEHDMIYLDVEIAELAEVITEEQVIELVRCGVNCNLENDGLTMFVQEVL